MEQIELESKYLKSVIKEINSQKIQKQRELQTLEKEKREFSLHFADDFYSMDDEEALGEGDMLSELDEAIYGAKKSYDRLLRQEYSPYFGRVDFVQRGKRKPTSYYIGVNNIVKQGKDVPLVCDWRAPVSSLFYDFELGLAEYFAPSGKVLGQIELKRQYKIKDKKLLKMFDSSLTIGDNILKDVLAGSASKKMKTIVSTIQKEQNKIIRSNSSKNMIVQGVAGSGKTSIALHRIAYLLYQNKNTLKAEDIVILSPNAVFADYISEVLPELGEENMSQMSLYRIANEELSFLKKGLEKREDCLFEVQNDKKRLNQVAYKHTYEFFESLKTFCQKYFDLAFVPKDLKFGKDIITAKEMQTLYEQTYISKSPAVRVEWIVDYIIDKLNIETSVNEVAHRLKRIIQPFFVETNILNIYANFLTSIGMNFGLTKDFKIKYDDLSSLLYIANYFMGLKKRSEVKYLIVDEMQDYSFVCYNVLNSIFDCKKILLGDINQCIEKIMTKEDLQTLTQMFDAEYIELNKAYRSTYEITDFANKIKNLNCQKFERHGCDPKIIEAKNISDCICKMAENSNYNSIAIITKNEKRARELYIELSDIDGLELVVDADQSCGKICIIPAYIAKGLEFDAVIVPDYNAKCYKTFLDNNLLYVACTRALHELVLVK